MNSLTCCCVDPLVIKYRFLRSLISMSCVKAPSYWSFFSSFGTAPTALDGEPDPKAPPVTPLMVAAIRAAMAAKEAKNALAMSQRFQVCCNSPAWAAASVLTGACVAFASSSHFRFEDMFVTEKMEGPRDANGIYFRISYDWRIRMLSRT